MVPIFAAGLLALQLAAEIPKPDLAAPPASHTRKQRNPLARLGRAIRRAGSIEPALAVRFSGWGIPDADRRPDSSRERM